MGRRSTRISIVIPTFNQAGHLQASVNACLVQEGQDRLDIDVVIVNDGCTDRTPELLDEMRKNPRVWTLPARKTGNAGAHDAINRGHEFALGHLRPDLLTWISSDTIMLPHWLSTLEKLIAEKGWDYAFGAYITEHGDMKRSGWYRHSGPQTMVGAWHDYDENYTMRSPWGPTTLYTVRAWLGAGEHDSGNAHDLGWWLRVEDATNFNGGNTKSPLCFYRCHSNTVTARITEAELAEECDALKLAALKRRGLA